MRVLIVYAHPNPASFNHAMLESCQRGLLEGGHEVRIKDLYAENFDPVLRASDLAVLQTGSIPEKIRHEQEGLLWADGLVFIYPLWWFDRPAILKGWFDHVLTNGTAFEYSQEGVKGLLQHQRALVLITAGGSEDYFRKTDAEHLIYRPVTDGTLAFCGIQDVRHSIYYNVPALSDTERAEILEAIATMGRNFAC
ncbi:NAD(P)H-dependent oxidoreductase [Candidatus Thiothrix sp. Deng01]|uniref:NAD(P)H-dependent oxidoreductase n=1 Tax=Candidatus Thiothrix phosphatis TaxID=3112415 RepID=A0ABU6CZG4_9GAMM|nr:NAD(P)H-dependent oxidoreductase [Candidatus Thiothrix sp. Deng01]MEB4592214.1 NAD(P)H-dependent oxidoreductase [Candidatus Thiothrix sp. Deng01]